MLCVARPLPQRGGWLEERPVNRFRVFGECMLTVAMIALSLAIGYGAMSAVSSQALFAGLN